MELSYGTVYDELERVIIVSHVFIFRHTFFEQVALLRRYLNISVVFVWTSAGLCA